MATLRTEADIQAEYTAVRAAYLRALEAEQYARSDGVGSSLSVRRAEVETLRAHMLALEAENTKLSRGGLTIRGAVPLDD